MVSGFDFGLDTEGELVLDEETSDIKRQVDNDLRIQLAYDRIKSVSTNWFVDHIGANLEYLIGKPCSREYADKGKSMIARQLTFDGLWDETEFVIQAKIKSNMAIEYYIYFKIYDKEEDETYSYDIIATIDLIYGVHIRYGWYPEKETRHMVDFDSVPDNKFDNELFTTIQNNTKSLYDAVNMWIALQGNEEDIDKLRKELQQDLICIEKILNNISNFEQYYELYNDIIMHYNTVTAVELTGVLNAIGRWEAKHGYIS